MRALAFFSIAHENLNAFTFSFLLPFSTSLERNAPVPVYCSFRTGADIEADNFSNGKDERVLYHKITQL